MMDDLQTCTVEEWQRLYVHSEIKGYDTKCRLCGRRTAKDGVAGLFRDLYGALLVFWYHGGYYHIGRANLIWQGNADWGWPLAEKLNGDKA